MINRVRSGRYLLVAFILSLTSVFADFIDYQGVVENDNGDPVEMARVEVEGTLLKTYTDSDGNFHLQGETATAAGNFSLGKEITPIRLNKSILHINNTNNEKVAVDLFGANGIRLQHIDAGKAANLQIPINNNDFGAGMYVLKISIGGKVYKQKIINASHHAFSGGVFDMVSGDVIALSKRQQAGPYVLAAAAPGHVSGTFSQNQASASNLVLTLVRQTSNQRDTFQQYYAGNGIITDISNNSVVRLPIEQRIHVVLFPEGYTDSELNDGKYENDLASWYRSVFVLEPLDFLREAFVIWKFPAASNEQVNPGGTADTYFKVPVSSSGIGSGFSNTAEITWGIIEQFEYRPQEFYPSGGRTHYYAKNVIVQFMVYNPQYGRSGFSGKATSLTNPSNSEERLAAAFAQNQQHEFMHAFARLYDEYYERDHSPLSSSSLREESAYINNVVSSNKCDEVPWRHLFYGGEFNPDTDSLIGAFGGNNGRYHPELKCLLNGSHDNSDIFGGSNNLRLYDRMCNWCRELTAYRVYERSQILADESVSWDVWKADYRIPFWDTFGFYIPDVVPQENSLGEPKFWPCEN